MPAPTAILPGKKVPALSLKLTDGLDWSLADETTGAFNLVVFYRGYHCPKCKDQLLDIQDHLVELQDLGVTTIAVSMDDAERAERARDEWGLQQIRFAHSLTAAGAREWGLFLSTSRGKTSIGVDEAALFNEPGLFLVKSDGTLFASWVQTAPWARPNTTDIISAVRFIQDKDYPPRGVVEDV